MIDEQLTIFAPSTPSGGAVAMVRISGAETRRLLEKYLRPAGGSFEPRMMTLARLVDEDGALIDECCAVFYRAPRSYTGEDMAEIFTHGSPAVLRKLFMLLSAEKNVRPADAGEFTKRAFLNGKTDLSGAEAVMDLISAGTELARRAASSQLSGGLRERIDGLYERLLDISAYLSAVIDYPDEMEDEAMAGGELLRRIRSVADDVGRLIENGLASRVLREGARVAILGEPNSGKSSLLNALLLRERAIVTPFAGTTRDTIEESADLNGVPVVFVDTAGIRQASDPVERLGVERSLREADIARAALWLHECGTPADDAELAALRSVNCQNILVVLTKSDLCSVPSPGESKAFEGMRTVLVSSKTGEGLERLKGVLASLLHSTDEPAIVTNTRHIAALQAAASSLASAESAVCGAGLDCCATDIAEALEHIGSVTGRTASEDVIDGIFSRFCVGK